MADSTVRSASKSTIRVRRSRAEDAEALAGLLEQLGYPATEEQVRSRLLSLSASSDHPVLVAELSLPTGETFVAGVLALQVGRLLHREELQAYVTALVTDRRCRHRGIARALIDSAGELTRRAGCEGLHARSKVGRDDAHAFYRALGFEETHLTFDKKL